MAIRNQVMWFGHRMPNPTAGESGNGLALGSSSRSRTTLIRAILLLIPVLGILASYSIPIQAQVGQSETTKAPVTEAAAQDPQLATPARPRVTPNFTITDPDETPEQIPPITVAGKRISFTRLRKDDSRLNIHLRDGIHPDHVEVLQKLEPLGTVFLGDLFPLETSVTVDDIKLLQDIPMTGLSLTGTFTDEHLNALTGHQHLESISLMRTQVTDACIDTLTSFPKLVKVSIQFGNITDVGVAKIADMEQLAVVHFFMCASITDEGVSQLAKLKSLEQLFLNNNEKLTRQIVKPVSTFKELNRLEMDGIKLTAADIADLTSLTKMEILGLSKTGVDDEGARCLSQMISLKSLNINDAKITDDGVAQLARLSGLQSLGLFNTNIGDRGVSSLVKLTNLQSLGLRSTKVTDQGIRELANLVNLRSLSLDNTAVTDQSIPIIDAFEKLRVLYLKETSVSPGAIAGLRERHPSLSVFSVVYPRPPVPPPPPPRRGR